MFHEPFLQHKDECMNNYQFLLFHSLTLIEILDILNEPDEEDGDDVHVIDNKILIAVQLPVELPEADTDKDSDQSDSEVTSNLDHLPRRILASKAEIITSKNFDNEAPSEIYPHNPPTSSQNTTKCYKPTPRKWTHSS